MRNFSLFLLGTWGDSNLNPFCLFRWINGVLVSFKTRNCQGMKRFKLTYRRRCDWKLVHSFTVDQQLGLLFYPKPMGLLVHRELIFSYLGIEVCLWVSLNTDWKRFELFIGLYIIIDEFEAGIILNGDGNAYLLPLLIPPLIFITSLFGAIFLNYRYKHKFNHQKKVNQAVYYFLWFGVLNWLLAVFDLIFRMTKSFWYFTPRKLVLSIFVGC